MTPSPPDATVPLLEVRKLTLRFGGLTAIRDVDLRVEEGQIAAVIGPNGAGKTSLFNAITGIYEPTLGEVLLDGQDVRQPLNRGHVARWLLTGLFTGMLSLLAAANVDTLWAAVVKSVDPNTFSTSQAFASAAAYLRAEPRVEFRVGRFQVVSADGLRLLGSSKIRADAEALRDKLAAQLDAGLAADATPLLQQTAADARSARILRLIVFLAGSGLGIAGAHAVWKRTRRTPTSVARRGIARTFQNIRLFHNMTVLENVVVAMDRHLRHRVPWTDKTRLFDTLLPIALGLVLVGLALSVRKATPEAAESGIPQALLVVLVLGGAGWLVRSGRRGAFSNASLVVEALARTEAQELLRFVGLHAKQHEVSRNLAYGEQRRLEIARALATRPRLLLLDEPAAGMNPSETVALMQLIREIRDRKVTVLLIEHHMRVVMGISDRITVLVHGARIAEGTPEQIRNNPAVIEAYLGTEGEG